MNEGLNTVFLMGNLGADPELRMTPSGTSVLKLRLATTEVYFDKDNAKQERVEWHNVTVFGKRADALNRFLTKGALVTVTGRIHYSSSEKDGQKRYFTEIIADKLFLGGAPPGRQNGMIPQVPSQTPTGTIDIPF